MLKNIVCEVEDSIYLSVVIMVPLMRKGIIKTVTEIDCDPGNPFREVRNVFGEKKPKKVSGGCDNDELDH